MESSNELISALQVHVASKGVETAAKVAQIESVQGTLE